MIFDRQIWLILALGFVWWQLCRCTDRPAQSHSPTHETADVETIQITPLKLGVLQIAAGEFLMGSEK